LHHIKQDIPKINIRNSSKIKNHIIKTTRTLFLLIRINKKYIENLNLTLLSGSKVKLLYYL
jgi:hypothetical protein